MDIKELRIGNLIDHSELGIVEIIAVGKDYIHCVFNGETFYENVRCFSPIPLTEERLKENGEFICFQNDDKQYKINGISILVNGYDPTIIKIYEAYLSYFF